MSDDSSRRKFLGQVFASAAVTGLGIISTVTSAASAPVSKRADSQKSGKPDSEEEEEISPIEDLMREHGLLNRLLLIYDHASLTSARDSKFDFEALGESVEIMRSFIEEYHERLEEKHLFPVFEKAGKLVDLTEILRTQHERGRELTKLISQSVKRKDGKELNGRLSLFVRMYRPHEAREDTVLFPAFRALVSESRYKEMGEQFEDREHELFGKAGFGGMVDRVATIEKKFGLHDLSKFTPARSES